MSKNRVSKLLAVAAMSFGFLISNAGFAASPAPKAPQPQNETLTREVQHQLRMLNYYTVFDNITFRVDGTRVILEGQVAKSAVKTEAVGTVKNIQGVTDVQDNIKVLPLSSHDDRIRRAAYQSIYGYPQLRKYEFQSVQSIHIIVDRGHITLEGFVDSQSDKNVAGIRANSVPGAFSMKNNLIVPEGKGK
jgi:hyperosmotically inducible protein